MDLSDAEVQDIRCAPLDMGAFPVHTVTVERVVKAAVVFFFGRSGASGSSASEAAGRGGGDAVVLQLRRCHVDGAEYSETRSSQTRATEQHVLRRVRLFPAYEAELRRARHPAHAGEGGSRSCGDTDGTGSSG